MRNDITGIILCGGKSSRMQTNKALLQLGDKTVIEIVIAEMKKVFSNIILSSNNTNELSFLNIPVVCDFKSNAGPLAGIYSALKNSNTDLNFITTCDFPLINSNIISFISNIDSKKDIIIPCIHSMPERLFGIYKKSVIDIIEEIFSDSEKDKTVKGSVYDLHQRVDVDEIEISKLGFYNDSLFLNMNSPEDYEKVKSIYQSL